MTDNDARTDPPPNRGERLSRSQWSTPGGGVVSEVYEVVDDRFPAGTVLIVDSNSSGYSMQAIRPDGESLGIWWSAPPDESSELMVYITPPS
jgi:hypothetical protein